MKRALVLVPLLALLAACNTTMPKDLGCSTEVGSAETDYNAVVAGEADGTMTTDDVAKKMGSVAGHFATVSQINTVPDIRDGSASASTLAGQVRVALLGGDDVAAADTISKLRVQIDAIDAACTAAAK